MQIDRMKDLDFELLTDAIYFFLNPMLTVPSRVRLTSFVVESMKYLGDPEACSNMGNDVRKNAVEKDNLIPTDTRAQNWDESGNSGYWRYSTEATIVVFVEPCIFLHTTILNCSDLWKQSFSIDDRAALSDGRGKLCTCSRIQEQICPGRNAQKATNTYYWIWQQNMITWKPFSYKRLEKLLYMLKYNRWNGDDVNKWHYDDWIS